jgi:preprotein translocase subunit SecD
MRWMLLLTGWLLLMLTPAQAGHSPPKIFLRVHVQTAGEGLPASQATSIALPPNGETIQIRTLPEFSERELIGVQVDPSGPVHLQFNHQGQVNLSAVTGQNQGRILVVLIDGYVVYAPIIDEQITSGELILPHPLSPQIIQLLQETARRNVESASHS